jgi:hypothetical protein
MQDNPDIVKASKQFLIDCRVEKFGEIVSHLIDDSWLPHAFIFSALIWMILHP